MRETDASCPDIGLLPQLCRVLGITADELLNGKTETVTLVPAAQRKGVEDLIMRIYVKSSDGDKVKVNLPMSLVKLGVEIGTVAMPSIGDDAGKLLQTVDLEKVLAMAEQGLIGKLVEVESADGDVVEITVE